jgi:hypothetical protein
MTVADDLSTEPLNHTIKSFSARLPCHPSTTKRIISHGLVKVVYVGDRPLIPHQELLRIAREGLPNIPAGYKRKTVGPTNGGRKRVAKEKAAEAKLDRAKPTRLSTRKRSSGDGRVAP